MTAFEHPQPAKTMVTALGDLAQVEAERDAAVAKVERVRALIVDRRSLHQRWDKTIAAYVLVDDIKEALEDPS